MAKRLDWEKRNIAGKRKVSISDEKDFMGRDLASRWLARAESQQRQLKQQKAIRTERPAKPTRSKQKDECSDPFSQAPGTDMRRPPWD
jgi:hypothetical protein